MIVRGSRDFQIVGQASFTMIDALFTAFPKTKKKGYIWKFKQVNVPGLDAPVTFQVHQGLYGTNSNEAADSTSKCKGGFYFNTFTSEKYKEIRLNQNRPNEQPAILIYVKRGRNFAIGTKEEAELIKTYLETIYKTADAA